jgi:hypothetical protein
MFHIIMIIGLVCMLAMGHPLNGLAGLLGGVYLFFLPSAIASRFTNKDED